MFAPTDRATLATLELVRNGLIQLEQDAPYAPVHIRLAGAEQA